MTMSRSDLPRIRNVSHKSRRENQNTNFMFINFSPENRSVYEIMRKNIVQLDWPQAHTLSTCNTYCFSMMTMVTRTALNVTFMCSLPVSLYYKSEFQCLWFERNRLNLTTTEHAHHTDAVSTVSATAE